MADCLGVMLQHKMLLIVQHILTSAENVHFDYLCLVNRTQREESMQDCWFVEASLKE
jgi:hypothetical protein